MGHGGPAPLWASLSVEVAARFQPVLGVSEDADDVGTPLTFVAARFATMVPGVAPKSLFYTTCERRGVLVRISQPSLVRTAVLEKK